MVTKRASVLDKDDQIIMGAYNPVEAQLEILQTELNNLNRSDRELREESRGILKIQNSYLKKKVKELERLSNDRLAQIGELKLENAKLGNYKFNSGKLVDKLQEQNRNLKFYLTASNLDLNRSTKSPTPSNKPGSPQLHQPNFAQVIFNIKSNTPTLTDLLEFDKYWYKLSKNLLVYGFDQTVAHFNKKDKSSLTAPKSTTDDKTQLKDIDEEKLLTCILQETIDPGLLYLFDDVLFLPPSHKVSNAVCFLIRINEQCLCEKAKLVPNLKFKMDKWRIPQGPISNPNSTSKDPIESAKSHYFNLFQKVHDQITRYSLQNELPANEILKFAYRGIRLSSPEYTSWAEEFEELHGLDQYDAYLAFDDLADLQAQCYPKVKTLDFCLFLGSVVLGFVMLVLLCTWISFH
ncbi:unnamed protein product [Ambrosiozyma monospora]|uniref:Unnamed protein product n=1 Tax=Ambrosiozyma monospora TaxID=43982 RepID=A0ACB5SUY6_AMBMO|nr:unnamed protein product [Ambrosiozyma monospora]